MPSRIAVTLRMIDDNAQVHGSYVIGDVLRDDDTHKEGGT